MPRLPPVTNARFPVRSINAAPRSRSTLQPILNEITDHMLDGEMELLNARSIVDGNHQACVRQPFELSTALAEECDDRDAARAGRLGGANHVATLAARRVQHQQIARLGERLHLAREDLVESHVVSAGGE